MARKLAGQMPNPGTAFFFARTPKVRRIPAFFAASQPTPAAAVFRLQRLHAKFAPLVCEHRNAKTSASVATPGILFDNAYSDCRLRGPALIGTWFRSFLHHICTFCAHLLGRSSLGFRDSDFGFAASPRQDCRLSLRERNQWPA